MPTAEQLIQLAVLALLRHPDTMFPAGEIADLILSRDFRHEWARFGLSTWQADRDELARKLGQALSQHVRRTRKSDRAVERYPKNNWSYGNRAIQFLGGAHADFPDQIDRTRRGLVGEFAVIAELLARGWNAGKLPVDDGVDIVATRKDELRTIQVKTGIASRQYPVEFKFTVDAAAQERYGGITHFYALVMRRYVVRRWVHDVIVLPSRDLVQWGVRAGNAEAPTWTVSVVMEGDSYCLGPDRRDVSDHVNDFGRLG
jgi:hypothetical protein